MQEVQEAVKVRLRGPLDSFTDDFISSNEEQLRIYKSDSCYLEGVLGDGFNDLLERHFGGESVAVVDDGFTFISIPAVQLHTATALIQSPVSERHMINLTPQDDHTN